MLRQRSDIDWKNDSFCICMKRILARKRKNSHLHFRVLKRVQQNFLESPDSRKGVKNSAWWALNLRMFTFQNLSRTMWINRIMGFAYPNSPFRFVGCMEGQQRTKFLKLSRDAKVNLKMPNTAVRLPLGPNIDINLKSGHIWCNAPFDIYTKESFIREGEYWGSWSDLEIEKFDRRLRRTQNNGRGSLRQW